MKSEINLKKYFKRIGYTGSPDTSLATLRKLQRCHLQAIAFENLNPLRGLPVKLDIGSLQQKMVDHQRGGYCYEHNLLFYHVLRAIGFEVTRLSGRVRWNKEEDEHSARTHMLLQVSVNGQPYICDVGFGGQTPTAPLALKPGQEQDTPHEPCRIIQRAGGYISQTYITDTWKNMYWFDLEAQHMADYKVANWYSSTCPDSHFVGRLIMARPDDDRRYVLSNNRFAVHLLNGDTEKRRVKSADELQQLLTDIFLIEPPEIESMKATFERIVAQDQ